jgi:putative flippase GtrA
MRPRLVSLFGVATLWRVRHYGGFALAGLLAFATDAAILEALMRGAAFSPYLARPIGISASMVVSWIVNRTVTFAMRTRPSPKEVLQFAAVSWTAQVVNYLVFVLILALVSGTPPFLALVVAAAVSMFLSYTGFRYAVFGHQLRAGSASRTE